MDDIYRLDLLIPGSVVNIEIAPGKRLAGNSLIKEFRPRPAGETHIAPLLRQHQPDMPANETAAADNQVATPIA
jgi:hypothetical protein